MKSDEKTKPLKPYAPFTLSLLVAVLTGLGASCTTKRTATVCSPGQGVKSSFPCRWRIASTRRSSGWISMAMVGGIPEK
jgi:hypothetical protein